MDIVFNCPNCAQELAVDHSGAGRQIDCPSCGQHITIPASGKVTTGPLPPMASPPPAPSAIASSAAARVALHLKVPVRDKPGEILIDKPKPPLEIVQKGAGKRLRICTIRRAACVESGHDHFDERVSDLLGQITETNLVGIHVVNYDFFDVATHKMTSDYGVMIVYRG